MSSAMACTRILYLDSPLRATSNAAFHLSIGAKTRVGASAHSIPREYMQSNCPSAMPRCLRLLYARTKVDARAHFKPLQQNQSTCIGTASRAMDQSLYALLLSHCLLPQSRHRRVHKKQEILSMSNFP